MVALRDQYLGGISNFRCLHPSTILEIVGILEAEQWFMEMENLLRLAWVMEANKLDVIMIQLMDIVRTWWQSKANKTTTIDLARCFLNKLPC